MDFISDNEKEGTAGAPSGSESGPGDWRVKRQWNEGSRDEDTGL